MRILVAIFIFIRFSLTGQEYFYLSNGSFPRSAAYYQVLEEKDRIFIVKPTLCDFRECSSVSEIDVLGNLKWSIELPNTDVGPHSSCIYNDTLYVSGNYSPGDGITALHKISFDGTLQKSYLYFDSLKQINRSLILDLNRFNNKFIITGQGFINEKSKGIIIAIDINSMALDTILSDTTLEVSTVMDHYVGPDSLLTCFYYQVNKFWPDQVRRIIKYDADFRQVWSYTSDTLDRNTTFPYGTVLRDGRIAFVDFNPAQTTGLNSLRCLDTITKQNDWMYSYTNVQSWERRLRSVKQLRNGDIICTGEYTTKATEPRIEGSPYMMRIDSTGKRLWEHAYVEIAPDGEDKGGNLWDVIELDNGDLMAVGFVTNNNKWDPLIIRTDHRGCMDGDNTNCPTVQIIDLMSGVVDVLDNSSTLSISPNPTYDQINITMPDNINLPLAYELISISGQRLWVGSHDSPSPMTIDVDHLPSGIYIIQMKDAQGKIWRSKWVKQ